MPLHAGVVAGGSVGTASKLQFPGLNSPEANGFEFMPERRPPLSQGCTHDAHSEDGSECGDDHQSEEDGDWSALRRATKHLLDHALWKNGLVMGMIGLNTAIMAFECNYPDWSEWWIIEDFFLYFFIIEILLRLYVHRCRFFTNEAERTWNIFELSVVLCGILDMSLSKLLPPEGRGAKVMTIFRIIRIIRILRSCRLLKHFKQLYLLVQGFLHSMQAVFWIGVLFFLMVLIAGIMVTSILGDNASDWASPGSEASEDEDSRAIKEKFGSLGKSMVTMFQLVTLDNWGDINALVAKRMPLMTLFFIMYILTTAFAMIALLTGVITEHVTSVSRISEQAEEEEKFRDYVKNLERVFHKAAAEGCQVGLSFDEICKLLEDDKVASKLELKNTVITTDDLCDIFKAMDLSGDGRVSWDEFRHGLKDMHGTASAKEVALLRADMAQVGQLLNTLACGSDLPQRIAALESQVQRLEGTMQSFLRVAGTFAVSRTRGSA